MSGLAGSCAWDRCPKLTKCSQNVRGAAPCEYPSGVAGNDYEYRARLPLLCEAIKGWQAYREAFNRLQVAKLARDPTGSAPDTPGEASLREITGERHEAINSIDDRFNEWILFPKSQRCRQDKFSHACLSSAEVDKIHIAMVQAAAKAN
jgi:hypothetical protein